MADDSLGVSRYHPLVVAASLGVSALEPKASPVDAKPLPEKQPRWDLLRGWSLTQRLRPVTAAG